MNEIQKSYLERFVEEDAMVEAVRQAIEKELDNFIPKVTSDVSNEIIGQNYRAFKLALELIQESFKNLALYKRSERGKDNFNRAR